MLKFSRIALLSALLTLSASALADDAKATDAKPAADKPVALVNGVAIPQSRLDLRVKVATNQGQPDSPELRNAIRDDLINLEVLSQAAVKAGIDKQPDNMQQLELARQSVLAGTYVQNYAKTHPVADDVLKQDYEAFKARIGSKEYKVSHILVKTQDDAKAIIKQLKKEKFAKLAKAKSIDPGSKENGGDLGWTVPTNFVQPFGEALMKLNKGETSEPVQTQFGWHIIRLDDTRDLKAPSFDEVKPKLENRRLQETVQKEIADLREKAKIE